MEKVNCYKCVYYYVTWDPKFPKGCRFFGFKTAGTPSADVYRSAGASCNGFAKKNTEKDKNE